MRSASFQIQVTPDDAIAFARLSGDWNPLHTDAAYAATTHYRRPVLHGAFSAGLVSRMAGMEIPGRECLLHGLRLRFLAPIVPPATLDVVGQEVEGSGEVGRVEVRISDAETGARYVDASYDFGLHDNAAPVASREAGILAEAAEAPILVTGATGGLGRAVLARLGARGLGVSRRAEEGMLQVSSLDALEGEIGDRRIGGIVHCAWPSPGNERLLEIGNLAGAVDHAVATPLRQTIAMAQLLARKGIDGAMLVLIGSAFASAGRHNYRLPLYTLAKSQIPELTRILATELAPLNRRCAALTFDVIDGGMNGQLSRALRVAHADRVPSGELPTPDDAAAQVLWLLDNAGNLVSGANISVTASAVP